MKSFVVFSAIVGNYDNILQPKVNCPEFDYILFSNTIVEKEIGIWQIRPIPYTNDDQTKIARWVKTNPELLLPEYKASLWIDANIQVNHISLYQRFVELHSDLSTMVSAVVHPQFNCVYDEMFYLLINHYEHESVILDWGHKIHKEHYPENNGAIETGLLYRRHSSKQVALFDDIWWGSIEKYSKRDQLSVGYALWKAHIANKPFFTDGSNVRNNEMVNYFDHQHAPSKYIAWGKNEAWLCRYAEKHPQKTQKIADLYYGIYSTCCPRLIARILGDAYRVKGMLHRYIEKKK